MKILFVQDSLGTGGAEKSNAELWYYLREQGVGIKIIVLEHRKVGIEREILEAGFDVTFLNSAGLIRQSGTIASIIRAFKPDIVHSVLIRSTLRVRMAKLFTSFFHIESLVNCTYSKVRFQDPKVNRMLLWFYMQVDKFTAHKTDRFVAITSEVKKHHNEVLRIPGEKIMIVYRGRKQNPFLKQRAAVRAELRAELNLHPNEIIFVHVGRQEFQKGHVVLMRALKQIEGKLQGKQVSFLMCGREGNATDSIVKYLETNPVRVNIKWLGHRHDVSRILAAADVFVFPSLYEGLGGALIEAQAASLPVICSDLNVFREVVNVNLNALTFKTGDHVSLSHAILTIINKSEMATTMGEKSLQNYLQNFQVEHINHQMFQVYKTVLT